MRVNFVPRRFGSCEIMTLKILRTPAVALFAALLIVSSAHAQSRTVANDSPYGGVTVEDIVARVNDQIITSSDYERAMKEFDDDARQRGESMQQISAGHKDLLRNLIDQQLWLSKGKELDINGETELIKKLDEIRKQYNLETIEDLEKAARDQGVSFEDFKQNIRNGIITQEVMREEIGKRVQITPGEVQRYFEAHKDQYNRPESVHLQEILISAGSPTPTIGSTTPEIDPAKLTAAKLKADDIESRLRAGGDFSQLARTFSDGPTAAQGGDLGEFRRGALAKVLEDKTFALKSGQYTEPIHTKQGYVILKVVEHIPGGVPPYKEVEQQAEEDYYMSRMEPAMRDYLTEMREEAFIDIKPGYVDTGASPKETKPIFSAYTPPAPKKKKKVERVRYRETTRTFRQKSAPVGDVAPTEQKPAAQTATAGQEPAAQTAHGKKVKLKKPKSQKAGKREKVRYGQAPRETLPSANDETKKEDAGALPPQQTAANDVPESPQPQPKVKTRFSARAGEVKQQKVKEKKKRAAFESSLNPAPEDAAEIADRQQQAAPVGLGGNTAPEKKKKKKKITKGNAGEKTRLSDEKKKSADTQQGEPSAPNPQTQAAPQPAPQAAPQQ